MSFSDLIKFSFAALYAMPLRSALSALGIAIGIAAVILLTAIGEGLHRYMISEFSQFGTNLLAITPGKTNTLGFSGALVNTVRPLTLEDARAIKKLPQITEVVPLVQGNAQLEAANRQRRTVVYGVSAGVPEVWKFNLASGHFLPADEITAPRAFVVLGSKIKQEIFPDSSALGEIIRVGSYRFRVVGVMESKGQMLGFDLDDAVYIPTSHAMTLFNQASLMEIDVLYRHDANVQATRDSIVTLIKTRHGNEDFSVVTQEQMLEVLTSVLDILTFAVAALGSISLLVGGVGILTIMTISVQERTFEIGLLSALGARQYQIMWLFLAEAIMLASMGGAAGLLLGWGSAMLINSLFVDLPIHISLTYVILAESLALIIGMLSGVIPARAAAVMSPLKALRSE